MGPLLGVAIGSIFGLYIDDFIASFIGAIFVSNALKPYGITLKRFFIIEFDWDLVKRCTSFGIKMGIPSLVSSFTKITSLSLCIIYIPQYTTFATLAWMARSLMAATTNLVQNNPRAIFVEAYQNDAKRLCQYYNMHTLRFNMINSGFIVSIMLMIISVLPLIFLGMGLDQYMLAIPFLLPSLIVRSFVPYKEYPNHLLIAAHKPNQIMVLNISLSFLRLLIWYLTIVVFKVQDMGIGGVIYVIAVTELPVDTLGFVITMLYINKSILKHKISIHQTIIVPIIGTALLYGFFTLISRLFLIKLFDINFYLAIGIGMILIILIVILGYFPLTVLLGGWDDNSINHLEKAVEMAGVSKIIVKPLVFFILKTKTRAKLHNRWKFNEDDALRDIYHLESLHNENRLK